MDQPKQLFPQEPESPYDAYDDWRYTWIDVTHTGSKYEEQVLGLLEPGTPQPVSQVRYRPFSGGSWIYGEPPI